MAAQSNHDQAEAQNITALSAGGIAEAAQSANHGGMADDPAAPANPAADSASTADTSAGGSESPTALG
ncbi:MAG: hypothetical protein IJ034_01170, partial [Mailhella sp.]|nr:hypothetical protein [Mailhella sp.]